MRNVEEMLMLLGKDLTKEFGKGYSRSNLEYMSSFYTTYQKRISQSMIGKSYQERLWKFFKKKILYDAYYEKFETFKKKSIDFFENIKIYEEELKTLLVDNFHFPHKEIIRKPCLV